MAEDNRDWGYRRIQGALRIWGPEIARSTIADILERHGIEPAPERRRKRTWKEFLTQHWDLIVAAEFFTVEAWTQSGLQRFVILFFIELSTRKVEIAGIAQNANGLWMSQIGRNLTDGADGPLKGKRYLIHDRDRCSRRVPGDGGRNRRSLGEDSAAKPESERTRGTVRAEHQGVLSRTNDSVG
jgi:putative transposase